MVLLVILCRRMFYSIHYNLTILFNVVAAGWMWMLCKKTFILFPAAVGLFFCPFLFFLISCFLSFTGAVWHPRGSRKCTGDWEFSGLTPRETHMFWWSHHTDSLSLSYTQKLLLWSVSDILCLELKLAAITDYFHLFSSISQLIVCQ